MKDLFEFIEIIILLSAICFALIGIFKPSIIIKRDFFGRRIVLILCSVFLLVIVGITDNYKIYHILTPKERVKFFAEIKQKEIQDSIADKKRIKEELSKDSIKEQQTKRKDSLKSVAISVEKSIVKRNDSIQATYPCVISNVKYKFKKVVGIGMDALKKHGGGYVVVSFELKNNSNHTLQLDQDNFRLTDGVNLYEISMEPQIESEFTTNLFAQYRLFDFFEEINPKITRKYKMIFEVSEDTDFKLVCYSKEVLIN